MKLLLLIVSLILVSATFTISNFLWISTMLTHDDIATAGWITAAICQVYVLVHIIVAMYNIYRKK